MAGKVIQSFLDYSREKSIVTWYIPDLDAGNIADWNAGGLTKLGTLNTAVDAVTLCRRESTSVVAAIIAGSSVTPDQQFAQREVGLRFHYQDTVTKKKYHVTVPGPNLNLFAEQGTDDVDPENLLIQAIIAEMESNIVSELGNPVEITHVRIVGRRV